MRSGYGVSEQRIQKFRSLVTSPDKVAPIAKLVEMHVVSVDPGRVRLRYAVKPEFMHPGRAVQGGIVTVYADMAMAMAGQTLCADGEFLATSQLSIAFLAPIRRGPVFADGSVARKGRSIYFLEAVVTDSDGVEMARATSIGVAVPTSPKA